MEAANQDAERQRWEEVVADLLAEAEGSSDDATKLDCLREAATMYEKQLDDPGRALAVWQVAFAARPDSEEAALAIERLTVALGSTESLLAECSVLLSTLDDPARRASLLRWMARWLERLAEDPEAAEQRLLEAATLQPGSVPVAEALSSIHAGRGDWLAAADVLLTAAAANPDPEEAVGMLLEAARLVQGHLGDAERATQIYRRVLQLNPSNALAAEAVAEASRAAADPAELCAEYRRALDAQPDDLNVLRKWAELAFEHQRWDDVKYLFDRLLARAGGGAVVADTRARLTEALDRCVSGRRWAEAVDVLQALAADATGPLRGKYHVTAGKIAQHELKNDDLAIEMFNRALDAVPDDAKIFERIYGMLSARRDWSKAEMHTRRMIERLVGRQAPGDEAVLLTLWRRLGDVYRMGLRDVAAARAAYAECARLAPGDERFLRLAAGIFDRQGVTPPPVSVG